MELEQFMEQLYALNVDGSFGVERFERTGPDSMRVVLGVEPFDWVEELAISRVELTVTGLLHWRFSSRRDPEHELWVTHDLKLAAQVEPLPYEVAGEACLVLSVGDNWIFCRDARVTAVEGAVAALFGPAGISA